MNKIFIWSVTAALAGFLFGFDTVVISGADKQLQLLWHSSDAFHGSVVMAMALWGTVIGAIFGGIPTNKIGRKKTLFWIGILYFISAIGAAFANDPIVFAAFRFIGGLGVGASTIAAPAYVSEIAPADKLSVSRVQLYRKVKAIIGINISDHINNVKLEKAAELLKSNEMNISEIAYSLGFSSPNYFSTAFKNKFGISPKEYKSSNSN